MKSNDKNDLNDFLEPLGDEITGFYGCQSESRPHNQEREFLVLEVVDNGCGMTGHAKESLFTRFFSTKGEQGTGIGLLITQKIVREHGGSIGVESREGEGTRFQIRLNRITA